MYTLSLIDLRNPSARLSSQHEIDMMMVSCHRGLAKMTGNQHHKSGMSLHGIAKFIFDHIDRDLNGTIDRGEYMSFLRDNPETHHYFRRINELIRSTKSISKEIHSTVKVDSRSKYGPRKTLNHPPFNKGATGGGALKVRVGGMSPGGFGTPVEEGVVFNDHTGIVSGGRFSSPVPPETLSPTKQTVRKVKTQYRPQATSTKQDEKEVHSGLGMAAPGGTPMDLELLRQIFSGVDSNLDGVIDVGEFYLSLKNTR